MEVEQILRMNGGEGDTSYANNSLIQRQVMLKAKPVLEKSITDLYTNALPECIKMADLGCSSGPNSLIMVSEIINIISKKLNHKQPPPMFQVFLNDLPGNDFNTIFGSLPSFYEKLEREKGKEIGPCFIAAMPGSFYGRLFPDHSLHFVHSCYSLQWRSQVPKELVSESGVPLNKGNIYIAKTSPTSVQKAFIDLFERDFTIFLRSRSKEMVHGGYLVLINIGREGDECTVWELLGTTLHDMVLEGLVEEAKLDLFNLPYYAPTPEETKRVIQAEGSFKIQEFEVFKVDWDANMNADKQGRGEYVAMSIRAVAESSLVSHFGEEIMNDLFDRYAKKMDNYLKVAKGEYTNMVMSMSKK